MKNLILASAFCLPLLAGCGKTETKTSPAVPDAPQHTQNRGDSQTPYYYGLIEELRTILAEDPTNLAVMIALGNAYSDSKQWQKAVAMYEHALLISPRNADVRADMATAFRNMGMPDRALAEYRTVLKYYSGHLNARFNLGAVYAFDKKDFAAATQVWEELLQLAPNHPRAEFMRSTIAGFRSAQKKGGK